MVARFNQGPMSQRELNDLASRRRKSIRQIGLENMAKQNEDLCPKCGHDPWGCGNPDCPYPHSITGDPVW